jgi:succinate-acetate transporter protein
MSLNDDTQTNINQKHELNKSTNYPQTIRKGPPPPFLDEDNLYGTFGTACFGTGTILLGIQVWGGYSNGKLLTIFGFFFGCLGQVVAGVMRFKYRRYAGGTTTFFFSLNWAMNTCYALFPTFGWCQPLGNKELGYHNLLACFYTFLFLMQNFNAPTLLIPLSSFFTFFGFVFGCIGNFADSNTLRKMAGVCNISTGSVAFYNAFSSTINTKYKRVLLPYFDGKQLGQRLD